MTKITKILFCLTAVALLSSGSVAFGQQLPNCQLVPGDPVSALFPTGDLLDVANLADRRPITVGFPPPLTWFDASHSTSTPVAPGELLSIQGRWILPNAGSTAVSATDAPWPMALGGVELLVNGVPAPVAYVGPRRDLPQGQYAIPDTEVIVQFPSDVTGSATVQVRQTAKGGSQCVGNVLTLPIVPTAPALVSDATGNPLVQRSDSVTVSYLTGMGALTNLVPTGAAAVIATEVVNPPYVTVNGVPVPVLYAGATPGMVGLYQINLAGAIAGEIKIVQGGRTITANLR